MALVPLQIKISTTSTVFLLYGLVRTVSIAVVVRTAVLRTRTCAQRPPQNDNTPLQNLSAPGNRGRKGTCTTVPYPVPLAPLPVIDRCDTLKPGTVRVHYTGQCLNCRLLSISYHIHPAMPGCYTTSPWCTKKFVRTNFFRY